MQLKVVAKAAAAAGTGLLLHMLRNAFRAELRTQSLQLETDHPFEPFTLLFIADIHSRKLPEHLPAGSPDLVIIGGDLTERGVPLKRVEHNLKVLRNIAPVVFAWGNNDRELDEQKLRNLFEACDITILENESVSLFGNPRLKLAVFDYFAFRRNGLQQTFSAVSEEDTVIFVSHTPEIFDRVQKGYKADLLLAGHTHGGQIRLGRFGLYEKGKTVWKNGAIRLISNGYGTTKLPLRLGAEAEYHLLTICPKP